MGAVLRCHKRAGQIHYEKLRLHGGNRRFEEGSLGGERHNEQCFSSRERRLIADLVREYILGLLIRSVE